MTQSIQALSQMENSQEKAALASELFGTKLSQELMPAIDSGALSIEEAQKKAEELGIVIGEDSLNAAEDFNDSWDDITRSLGAFGQKIIAKLMPTFQTMMDWVIVHMPQIQAVFSTVFDIIGVVITTVGDFIRDHIITRLQALYDWIVPDLPMIKEFFIDVFEYLVELLHGVIEVIKETTEWFREHWDIFEPILIGIAAGIVTFKLITAAIAAYGAITKAITAIQLLFNASLLANPIALVAILIGTLITAGGLLYKNWDTIKAKLDLFWSKIKGVFSTLGSFVSSTFNSIRDKTVEVFDKVFTAITTPINKAKDIVGNAIESIKGFFSGLSLKFPKIKMPKMPKVSMTGSMNPVKWVKEGLPKLSVKWNALGGVFTKPMVLNTATGLQGFGEVPGESEAVLPLNKKVLGGIGEGIAGTMTSSVNELNNVEGLLTEVIHAVKDGKVIKVNERVLGEVNDNEQARRTGLHTNERNSI